MILFNRRGLWIFAFLLCVSASYYKCFIYANSYSITDTNRELFALKTTLGTQYLDMNSTEAKAILSNNSIIFQNEFKSSANFVAIGSSIILSLFGLKLRNWDYPDSLLLSMPTMIVFLFHGIDNMILILTIFISFAGISLRKHQSRKSSYQSGSDTTK